MARLQVGIDVGGTKIHALVVDAGEVVGRARRETRPELGYAGVLRRIAETAAAAAEDAGTSMREVVSVGLGVPGPVSRGRVLLAPNLGWGEHAVADDLRIVLERPVALGNDVNLGALGEARFGAARGARSVFAAFVGTGLGGGLVIDGRVVEGAHGFAAELGHLPAPFGDAACSCGRRGCLETVASRTGIARLIAEAAARGERCLALLDGAPRASKLFDAFRAGCPATAAAIALAARALGWGLATAAGIADPEVFVIGGGVVERFGEEFAVRLRAAIPEFSLIYRERSPDVRVAALGDDAVARGAAELGANAAPARVPSHSGAAT
jgi:glucokinase